MENVYTQPSISEECSYLDVAFGDLNVDNVITQETFGYCGIFTEENLEENK